MQCHIRPSVSTPVLPAFDSFCLTRSVSASPPGRAKASSLRDRCRFWPAVIRGWAVCRVPMPRRDSKWGAHWATSLLKVDIYSLDLHLEAFGSTTELAQCELGRMGWLIKSIHARAHCSGLVISVRLTFATSMCSRTSLDAVIKTLRLRRSVIVRHFIADSRTTFNSGIDSMMPVVLPLFPPSCSRPSFSLKTPNSARPAFAIARPSSNFTYGPERQCKDSIEKVPF